MNRQVIVNFSLRWFLLALIFTGTSMVSRGDGTTWGQDSDTEDPTSTPVVAKKKYQNGDLILFDMDINVRAEKYFQRKLRSAKSRGADLVVIEIRSNGGTLEESLNIAETLRDVDWAHTVAFIPEKALSGAALASLGCDEIIMSSTSRIGDAGVIFMDENFMFRYAPEKLRTDVIRRARDLAEAKGRPPEFAEAMIDKGAVVYRMREPVPLQNEFRIKYFLDEEAEQPGDKKRENGLWNPDPLQWEMIEESGPTKFFDISGPRAVELGLADANLDNRQQLRERFELENDFFVHKHALVDSIVFILNHPLCTVLLFVVGSVALFFELSAPGISIGGLISGLCFSLFFWSRFLQGTAGWLEVILFAAGVIFVLVELFVIPGFGVAGVSGILLMLFSVVMASQSFVVPQTPADMQTTLTSVAVTLVSCVLVIGTVSALSRHLGKFPVFNRLILTPQPLDASLQASSIATGNKVHAEPALDAEGNDPRKVSTQTHPIVSVGDWGIAESVLRPSGKVRFDTFTVDVVADGSFLDEGQQVKVVEISGNRVVVKSVDE